MELSTTHLSLPCDAVVDLQTHTTYSDGTWLPAELLDYLLNEHFGLVAITDHDRADTAASLQALALEKRLPVLVAVEMTCFWKGEMTDLLCFGFDPESGELNALAQDVQHRQRENTREAYAHLRRNQSLCLPEADADEPPELTALLELPAARQPHALAALLQKQGCETPGQMLRQAGVAFAGSEVPAVVEAAHRDGGVCLIAHPGREDGFALYDQALLDELRQAAPIDGIEVYYPLHSPERTQFYLNYARKYGLLISAGSDSHSADRKPIPYRAELCRSLLERVGIQIL